MGSVGRALMWHEFFERSRDRWVLVASGLFALLACGVSLYGSGAGENAPALIGPSLVTLASLFVPLVALVLGHDAVVGEHERNTLGLLLSLPLGRGELVLGKFAGRLLALTLAIMLGLGLPMLFTGTFSAALLGHTLLLGAAFLSVGMLLSVLTRNQVTAASMAISLWFILVFFYDMGLLGLLVLSDGSVSNTLISWLVQLNPAGLFRIQMMTFYAGTEVLANLGLTTGLPSMLIGSSIWTAWIVGPALLGGLLLRRGRFI